MRLSAHSYLALLLLPLSTALAAWPMQRAVSSMSIALEQGHAPLYRRARTL